MSQKRIMTVLLIAAMLLSTGAATGCDQEAIKTAVLENLESAVFSGSDTDGEQSAQKEIETTEGNEEGNKETDVSVDGGSVDVVTAEPVKSKRTNVYQSIPIALPDEIGEGTGYVQDMVSIGDRIYMEYVLQNDDASETWLYSTDVTGDNQILVPFQDPFDEGSGYMTKLYAGEEKLYALYETWYENNGYWLMELDPADGSVTKLYDLNVAKDALGLTTEDSFYIVDVALSRHTVYLNRENVLVPYDLQTETCGSIIDLPEDVMGFASTYGTDEGIYFTAYNEQYEQNFYVLDPATGTATPTWIGAPGYFDPIGFYDGLLYFNIYDAVLTYDFEHGHVGEVLSFLNCDIHPSEVTHMVITADGTLVYYTGLDDGRISRIGGKLQTLERIPDDQLPEEVLLTLATTYYDYSVETAVVRYNRQTEGVHIAIQDYSYMADGEHNAAYWICEDIFGGEAPDMVLLDRFTPVETYYYKGALVDLYPYMDGANGIDRSQYFDNIFKACERNGKLYSLITNYSLETMAAKSAYVGSDAGWTLSEMLDTIEAMPDGMRAFSDYGRDDLLAQLMQYCGEHCIDWENGTTSFASEDLMRLLTYLKTYPEKSVLNAYYEGGETDAGTNFMRAYDMRYYKDTALLETAYIYEVSGYWYLFRAFAENPTVIGYPTNEGSGTIVRPTLELGIAATSVNKDSAWEFLRYLLTAEDDLEMYESYLPISKARFEKLLDGSEAYYAGWYTYSEDDYDYMLQEYGEEYVTYHRQANQPYTKEMGQKVYDLAAGATKVTRMTDDVIAIIREEAGAYFADSQTVEEAAQSMDSRVQAYIAEIS